MPTGLTGGDMLRGQQDDDTGQVRRLEDLVPRPNTMCYRKRLGEMDCSLAQFRVLVQAPRQESQKNG